VPPILIGRRSLLGSGDSERLAPAWLKTSRAAGYVWLRRLTRHSNDGDVRRPFAPPACPAGWRTGPPDFVGVGAQRAGTTRWLGLIGSHPEVTPSPVAKELHYFDRFYCGGFTSADAARYREYFPRKEGCRAGEWTPLYASAPWVPRLLASAAPNARLLMLVRDPLERYLSGLQHSARMAKEFGTTLNRLAPLDAFARGFYHAQLSELMAHFDRAKILVLQYERCTLEPRAELRRTFEFLGLSDTEFVPDLDARPGYQPSKPTLDAETAAAYVRAYSDDVLSLARSFPEVDLALWPNFAHLAETAG
jgi:Sulfotransferase domain